MSAPAQKRMLCFYGGFALALIGLSLWLQQSAWKSNGLVHTMMETVACLTAFFCGVMALLRYYTRKAVEFLFIGVGFFGTFLLDGYHAAVTSDILNNNMPSPPQNLIPWSWGASRTYLGLLMVLSWYVSRGPRHRGRRFRLPDWVIYPLVVALAIVVFALFTFVPLPQAYYQDRFFHRPQEFVPAAFFLIALLGFIDKGGWKRDAFEHWLILSLILGFVGQAFAMPRSASLYDAMFDFAHLLKIVSYGCVMVGLLVATYRVFRDAERDASHLRELTTRLTLPRPDLELRHRVQLPLFSFSDMIQCGNSIRNLALTADGVSALDNATVRYLYENFVDADGQPAFALVRVFETRRFRELSGSLQRIAHAADPNANPNTRCLVLTATVGQEPAWCDVEQSVGHRVIPLSGKETARRLPMVTGLLEQLGLDTSGVFADKPIERKPDTRTCESFHVEEARGSQLVPAQGFVEKYGVRSVVGFGGLLPNDVLFVVILFSKVPIDKATADRLSQLSFDLGLARIAVDATIEERIEPQLETLSELVASKERLVIEQEQQLQEMVRQLQAQALELQRRNRELDQFAYVASHDLRSPLEGIKNLARWIVEDNEATLPAASKRHLDQLQRRIDRMERLLDDLLQYSRAGRLHGQVIEVDVARLVDDIRDLLAPPAGFVLRAEGKLPKLRTAKVPFEQVMRNLINNAIKHHDRDSGTVVVGCRDRGRFYEFTVTDDGPGIAPEFHERVFGMFESLKPQDETDSTGMGLAVVKKIVESYGGSVVLESDGKRGTTFRFTWPKKLRIKESTAAMDAEGVSRKKSPSPNREHAHGE